MTAGIVIEVQTVFSASLQQPRREYQLAMSLLPNELRLTPHSTYYSRFFLLRISVTICGQPAFINFDSGDLTLNCRLSYVSVAFPTISAQLEDILKKFGVLKVGNFYCEDFPLYQIIFSSEYDLRNFLRLRSRVQREVASLISSSLSQGKAVHRNLPAEVVVTTVQADLFLVSPDTEKKDARIVNVTLDNCAACMALWKESELFDFGAVFEVYDQGPSRHSDGGK